MIRKRKILFKLIFVLIIVQFHSCNFFPVEVKTLSKNIVLGAGDIPKQMHIQYHIEGGGSSILVDQTVFGVGYNKDFIIVKQHPTDILDLDSPINKDSVCYYIIDIKDIENQKVQYKIDSTRGYSIDKNRLGQDSIVEKQYKLSFTPIKPKVLTEQQFRIQKEKLGISDSLKFTINYNDL